MIVKSGRTAFADDEAVYAGLARLGPGLMLDIGAAAGHRTRRMIRACPQGEVWSFEPFPGNWPHFEATIGDDPRVRLIKAAAGDRAGREQFEVKSVVAAGRAGRWGELVGYSSVGRLSSVGTTPQDAQTFDVDTVAVDDLIGERAVNFAKIDVQGAERRVLAGMERALAEGRVAVVFVEFGGDLEVLSLLGQHFTLFDSLYVLRPKRGAEALDPDVWEVVETREASTGVRRFKAWPRGLPDTDYGAWFRQQSRKVSFMQCDLIGVRPDVLASFTAGAMPNGIPGSNE